MIYNEILVIPFLGRPEKKQPVVINDEESEKLLDDNQTP
jgi:hypothetical protein